MRDDFCKGSIVIPVVLVVDKNIPECIFKATDKNNKLRRNNQYIDGHVVQLFQTLFPLLSTSHDVCK